MAVPQVTHRHRRRARPHPVGLLGLERPITVAEQDRDRVSPSRSRSVGGPATPATLGLPSSHSRSQTPTASRLRPCHRPLPTGIRTSRNTSWTGTTSAPRPTRTTLHARSASRLSDTPAWSVAGIPSSPPARRESHHPSAELTHSTEPQRDRGDVRLRNACRPLRTHCKGVVFRAQVLLGTQLLLVGRRGKGVQSTRNDWRGNAAKPRHLRRRTGCSPCFRRG